MSLFRRSEPEHPNPERPNSVLERPLREFVEPLADVLAQLTAKTGRDTPATATNDVTLEAYNLACAVLDADDRHTDDEIWALLTTFGPKFPTQLAYASPNHVREARLLNGKKAWLNQPSPLLDLLIAADRKNGTNHAWVYYHRAIALGHHVIAVDMSPSETEIRALDSFRSMLVNTLERNGIPRELSFVPTAPGAPAAHSGGSGAGAGGTGGQPGGAGGATSGSAAGATAPTAPTEPEPLPPPEDIEDLLQELDELVGLKGVKTEVRLVTNLLQVHKLRRERNLPTPDSSLHLIFAGNPGTGKTTVARLLARIYRALGVVERGHLVETDRAGLVAGFVGQTALKVTEVFDKADQGVLLIDEAYSLARGGEKDFGQEAVDTIVKLIEDRRERLVVIAAGYPDEMGTFIGTNPGLSSRFPKTITFEDYSNDELVSIFAKLCAKNKYDPTPEALKAVRAYFAAQERIKGFGNGRVARNLFEKSMSTQASRLMSRAKDAAPPTDAELLAIEAEDIDPTLAPKPAPTPAPTLAPDRLKSATKAITRSKKSESAPSDNETPNREAPNNRPPNQGSTS